VKPMRLALLASLLASVLARATTPAPELQSRVRAATFEVVVPKPEDTGISYERTPPVELVPFAERNDKFFPIGTAFAIAPDTFVSAGHVVQASLGGMGGAPQLRDSSGKTYAIERVLKFSMHQDFVVFTAAVHAPKSLETHTSTTLDEPVFSVGNALGEGVVIRDGLLTSMTPEDQDGRWKWLRYSAATSPGNSGGPLLNASGQVIGVVIGKSPNENLNYALPIEHVISARNEAGIDVRVPLRIPVLRDSIVAKYTFSIPLPLKLADFEQKFQDQNILLYRGERDRLLKEHADELFPRGKTEKLLVSVGPAYCPMLIAQGEDRIWDVDGSRRQSTDLPDSGEVCTRMSAGVNMFNVDRGNGTDARFYTDRRAAMDLLLKGLSLPRGFGTEQVRMTSLGNPVRDEEYRDRYGRTWRLAVFALPFLDAHVVAMFLPTPNGYAGTLQFSARGYLDAVIDQQRFSTNYFYVSYTGTLPQWQAFLARKDLRPAAFERLSFTRDTTGMHFRSRRIDFDVPAALLEVTDKSTLDVQMSYSLEAGVPVWDIGAIYLNQQEDEKTYVAFIRQAKPAEAAGKELNDRWAEMLDSKGAFVPVRGHDNDYKKFWRRAAVGAGYRPGSGVDRNASLLYEVVSEVNDAKTPRRIDDMQDLLLENVRVKER